MANEQHVELLKKGVEGWNAWREENPNEAIDLSEADLRGGKLTNVNLQGANLEGAKLQFANLSGANLESANLSQARMQEVNLARARLNNARMQKCNLMEASLIETDMENADAQGAQFNEDVEFHQANLKGTNLVQASGLTVGQIKEARYDANTKLPEYLSDDTDDEDFLNSML